MRSTVAVCALSIAGALCLPACSLLGSTPPPTLARSLQELLPHSDGDHFVYVWERLKDGQPVDDGIQVEHVSALGDSGEFEVALSENGMATGRLRFRDDGRSIALLNEDDLTRGVRVTYNPPLVYLTAPLVAGESHASATASITRLADGQSGGSFQVTQLVQASAAPPVQWPFGNSTRAVRLHTVRTLQGPDGIQELNTVLLLLVGIGEIRSEGKGADSDILYRELACAAISGRRMGDCHDLNARVKELQHAGPTHLQ